MKILEAFHQSLAIAAYHGVLSHMQPGRVLERRRAVQLHRSRCGNYRLMAMSQPDTAAPAHDAPGPGCIARKQVKGMSALPCSAARSAAPHV